MADGQHLRIRLAGYYWYKIRLRLGAMITAGLGLIIMPWRLYNDLGAYIFTWLIGYSALLGPIAGIMLCDYFVLRRTRLDRDALYDPSGPYKGVNHRAMIALTNQGEQMPLTAGRLAELAEVPRSYLSKILATLVRTGIVASSRGVNGGFRLGRHAAEIILFEIVEPFERPGAFDSCLIQNSKPCSDECACSAHDAWRDLSREVHRFLRSTTLESLAG